MKLIHLDTDIGSDSDDLCALAMLLGMPDVQLTGITTNSEWGGLRVGFVRYTLQLAGRNDMPVAEGANSSISGYTMTPYVANVAENWPKPIAAQPSPPGAALDLLQQSID